MTTHSNVNAVLRIPDVRLSRVALEASVGPLDRFDADVGGVAYAQINAPDDCSWAEVTGLIERVGPSIQKHVECGQVGRPCLDVAIFIGGDSVAASLVVPTVVIAALGRFGLDLEASAYLAGEA